MNTPLNLDLDFLDYTPPAANTTSTGEPGDVNSSRHQNDRAGIQISIPEANQLQPQPTSSTAGNLFQNLFSNAAKFGSQSAISDEALRQMISASNRQKHQQKSTTTGSFNWGINYFAGYFDVTTTDVIERILWSAIPLRKTGPDIDNLDDTEELMAPLADGSTLDSASGREEQYGSRQRPYSYIERFIQSRPDLYGPFWISATLVFVVAIFSNIVGFASHNSRMEQLALEHQRQLGLSGINKSSGVLLLVNNEDQLDKWHYSMDELNMTSSLVMLYVSMMPTFLWFLFWFRGCSKFYTLTETICAYGYSLSVFIPLALILTIQVPLVRYLMITLATTLSSVVLMLSFLPVVRSDPDPASSHMILAIVPLCQFGLAYSIHRIMLQS